MGNKYSTSMAYNNLSPQISLTKDKDVISKDSYIIMLGDDYYTCNWNSKWVMINKVDDTEHDLSTDYENSEDSNVGMFTGEYFRAIDIDRDISNLGEKSDQNNEFYHTDHGSLDKNISKTSGNYENNNKMSAIEEVLNLSPIDGFTFEGFADEDVQSQTFLTDDHNVDKSVIMNVTDNLQYVYNDNQFSSDDTQSSSDDCQFSSDDSQTSSDDSELDVEGYFDPTLIFEFMNQHRSPLHIIFEQSLEYDITQNNDICSKRHTLALSEEFHIYSSEESSASDILITKPLSDVPINVIGNNGLEINVDDHTRTAIQGDSDVEESQEHHTRFTSPEISDDKDSDAIQRSSSPGDSGLEELGDSEFETESYNDQYSEISEESDCKDLESNTIDTNLPLVINQCLEVFNQLSLANIVNRNIHFDIIQ